MTRDSDADPTFDDRAAMANQFADAIFVSLHVASTGTAGTVRVYYYKLSIPFTFSAADTGAPSAGTVAQQPQSGVPATADGEKLVPWRQAQSLSIGGSQRLAELVQSGLAQKFPGSPAGSTSAAVRDLRSVTAPAIAIEISNISAPKVTTLEEMSPAIAAAIAQSVAVFHPAGIINGSSSSTGAAH
jgi:N-acetylmuramoyl-L-alanine amidase